MSREKVEGTEKNISSAIQGLQSRLGETQEGMARRIGCTLGAYVKWRRGEREPSGAWLIRMINLCPDDDSLKTFGIEIPQSSLEKTRKAQTQKEAVVGDDNEKIARSARRAREIFAHLRSEADSGNRFAKEVLESLQEEAIRGSGIATDPELPKARRKEDLKEAIRALSSRKIRTIKGV